MAGTASATEPKNSRHTVRTWAGMRCSTKVAEVIRPSQPSFWMPGRPDRNLSVTSLPSPALRNCGRSAGQGGVLHCPELVQLFGIDHRGQPGERHRATGIASTAAAWNESE